MGQPAVAASLVAPASAVGADGVKLSDTAADMLSEFPTNTPTRRRWRITPAGRPLPQQVLKPDLADTLQAMADGG